MTGHIPHLYVEDILHSGSALELTQDSLHRLRSVMRLREGSEVRVFNGRQGLWRSYVKLEGRHHVYLGVDCALKEQPHVMNDLTLYVPLIKPQRLGNLVRQAVELGVNRLVPFRSAYGGGSYTWNVSRMEGVVVGALEQSGRLLLPEVCKPLSFEDVLRGHDSRYPLFACLEHGVGEGRMMWKVLGDFLQGRKASIIVGPEGGFSAEEHEWFQEREGIHPVSLGRYILRSETASSLAVGMWISSREGF
jgi:16S rRNA (uracil1498-N3)-methyltransferase